MSYKSSHLTIMMSDIVGFTAMTSKMSRDDMIELLELHGHLIRPVIDHYQGRVVKTIGDAFLSVFDSPTNAVLCAIMIQHVLCSYNMARSKADHLHIRIALNAGEVQVAEDGDIYGDAVNATGRLEGVTEKDEIYFTEQVYLTINRNEIPKTRYVNQYSFKGIPEEVRVYKVIQQSRNEIYQRIIATKIDIPGHKCPVKNHIISAGYRYSGAVSCNQLL